MRRPKLNNLEAFVAAGEYLNFRLAAEELHLTQGAVAQQVRGLEAALGVQLFHRQARGVALTPEGQRYHAEIAQALGIVTRATDALRARGTDVTISVPPSFATKWLVPRLPDFATAHPGIALKVLAEEAVVDISAGRADLAVRQGAGPEARGVTVTRLCDEALVAVGAPEMEPVSGLAQIAAFDLVEDGHGHWTRLLEASGLVHGGRMLRVNQTALAMDAAIGGQGAALVPRLYLTDALAAGVLRVLWTPPVHERPETGFHLVHARQPVAAVRRVRAWITARMTGVKDDKRP